MATLPFRSLTLALVVATGMLAARAAASDPAVSAPSESNLIGPCPAPGDCCSPHGGQGCNDSACCNTVCSASANCCEIGWDQNCAALAQTICGPSACTSACPSNGSCCETHGNAGCSDAFCCDLVCTQEPFCCEGLWTQQCADLAVILCDDICAATEACPGAGSCCVSGDAIACNDESCCRLTCSEDPYCCEVEWDAYCAAEAAWLCAPLCEGPCPSEGDCCEFHETPGCRDTACCSAVCNEEPGCCEIQWDETCVAYATQVCGSLCTGACPGPDSCCTLHASSGCSDAACCAAVCKEEAFCCFLNWGVDCVSAANDLCGDLCSAPAVCPGSGDCCSVHAGTGCDDEACCERVCADDPTCCSGDWTSACAELAADVCGLSCRCPAGFADFDSSMTVDLLDFAEFQRCFTGLSALTLPFSECACGDAANNGDVNASDAKAFVGQWTGP